ncbi:hypothetical protein K466DRAFT_502316 [Polyporus arcularius HHB13444]|uniref:Uncharacterized protein n=1 Tax=Polyporus arcularius HHB13444 TaxID=1314778 RepID=A0A5C3P6B2_9APHY|nr:hypothetical protein K466DRAFT_502316 [Polyporus arcularius HHB13444]
MDDKTADALRKWKEHRYRPTDLPFGEAVDSLFTSEPLIEVRRSETRKTDWVICRAGTTTPALFVFAGVFSESDPYETGNLVPVKTAIPAGLDSTRVANHAGYKAAYSYALDTFHDKNMWEYQGTLDTHMSTVPGFNARGLKRREWQNGSTWHVRYWLRVPMFLTCETRAGRPEPPAGLHEWVVNAHNRTKNYRANPIRPIVCGLENGRLQDIAKCTPNVLEYGDVVSLVFSLAYVEDREDWGPVPMVTHIIRVQHANREAYPLAAAFVIEEPLLDASGLCFGAVVDGEYPLLERKCDVERRR